MAEPKRHMDVPKERVLNGDTWPAPLPDLKTRYPKLIGGSGTRSQRPQPTEEVLHGFELHPRTRGVPR